MKTLHALVDAFRHAFGSRTSSHRRPAAPRCAGCRHFVPGLCEQGCGYCPLCCPGHRQETSQ
jgi:hypothetical protein